MAEWILKPAGFIGRFVEPGSTIPPSAFTLINDDAVISCHDKPYGLIKNNSSFGSSDGTFTVICVWIKCLHQQCSFCFLLIKRIFVLQIM